MLKKAVSIIAAVTLMLSLAACSSQSQGEATEQSQGEATEQSQGEATEQPQSEAVEMLAESGFGSLLPAPSFGTVEVTFESGEQISVEFAGATQDDYKSYTEVCKSIGFTGDAETWATAYEAYNADGYRLVLQYSDSDEGSIDVYLYAPLEMNPVSWPTIGLATLVPAPESTVGAVTSDASKFFHAYVGETDLNAFNQYVKACQDAGFTADYTSSDGYYWAYDEHGVRLEVSYQGFNTMSIDLNASDVDLSFLEGSSS